MRRTERAAYRTKFYSNLSSPTRFDEEPIKENALLLFSFIFLYKILSLFYDYSLKNRLSIFSYLITLFSVYFYLAPTATAVKAR